MFIGHYKSVSKTEEFYSEKRDDLQFPTQVEYNGSRFLLVRTVQLSTKATEKRFYESVKENSIPYDVKIS